MKGLGKDQVRDEEIMLRKHRVLSPYIILWSEFVLKSQVFFAYKPPTHLKYQNFSLVNWISSHHLNIWPFWMVKFKYFLQGLISKLKVITIKIIRSFDTAFPNIHTSYKSPYTISRSLQSRVTKHQCPVNMAVWFLYSYSAFCENKLPINIECLLIHLSGW